MCTNGSRSAMATPWNARRTGKPSPSRPLGAVVSLRTGRGREVGPGDSMRVSVVRSSTLTAGMSLKTRWRLGYSLRATRRQVPGLERPVCKKAKLGLDTGRRGEEEGLVARPPDERQPDGQAPNDPHRHRRDRPPRDRRGAADARVRRGVTAERQVVLPRRPIGGGDDEVDRRERGLQALRSGPCEVALARRRVVRRCPAAGGERSLEE